MPAPTFVAEGALSVAASGTTQTPTPPAHVADDIIIAWAGNRGGAAQTITIPAGWTALGVPLSGDPDLNFVLCWRRATGPGTAGPTFTHGAAGSSTIGHYAGTFVIRGAATTGTPFEGIINRGPVASNAPKWGSHTTLGPDRLIFALFVVEAVEGMSNSVLTGWTEHGNNGSTTGGGWYYYGLHGPQATPATLPEANFVNAPGTKAGASPWASISLAVIPAGSDVETSGTQVAAADATGASSLTGGIDAAGTQAATADATGASSRTGAISTDGLQAATADATGSSVVGTVIDTVGLALAAAVVAGESELGFEPVGDAVIRVLAYGFSDTVTSLPGDVVTFGVAVATADAAGASSSGGTVTTAGVAIAVGVAEGSSFTVTPGAPGPVGAAAPEWVWELITFDGERLRELTARQRRLVLPVAATPSASFALDLLEAAGYPELRPGEVDLIVSRNGRPIYRGPIGGATGSGLTIVGGALTFPSTGIAELLADRFIPAGRELASLEAAHLLWQLIADTQALPGGHLGIVAGDLVDSVARTKKWDTPTPILSELRSIAELEDGIEWAIEPNAAGAYRFDTWYPRRGANRGVVLEAGRNIANVDGTWDAGPGRLANEVTTAGVNQVAVTERDEASIARYRLRQRFLSLPDSDDASALGARSRAELERDAVVRALPRVVLAPGKPDASLDSIALGDVVEVDYRVGWVELTGLHRVNEIQVELPDARGFEALTLTLEPFHA